MTIKLRPFLAVLAIFVVLIFGLVTIIQYNNPPDILSPEERFWLSQHGPIRLAPDPNFPPLEYFNENGEYKGLIADYFALLEKKLGVKITYVHGDTWNKILDMAQRGEIDGITAAQVTPERSEYLTFTQPIIDIPNVIIVPETNHKNLRFGDMEGMSLAVTEGYALDEYVGEHYPGIRRVAVADDLEALKLVSFNQVDAAVINSAVASYLIEKQGLTNLRIAGDSDRTNQLSIATLRGMPTLNSIFRKGLTSINDDERRSINSNWMRLKDNSPWNFSRETWVLIGVAGSIMLLVVLVISAWNFMLRMQVKKQTDALERELEERKRFESKIQGQIERLSALQMIDSAISASLDLRLVLNIFLEQVINQLKVDAADVLLLNHYNQVLEYAAGMGFRTSKFKETQISLGYSSAGVVAMERRLVSIPSISDSDSFLKKESFATEGFNSYYGVPLIAKGEVKGVLEVYFRNASKVDEDWLDFLQLLAGQAAIAIDNAEMFDKLKRSNNELIKSYEATIEGWSAALDLRDNETEGHSLRVTEMTMKMCKSLGMSDEELAHIRRGALLHDIGKVGIPDKILYKPGPLNEEEWEIMRNHPLYSYNMLAPISFLKKALDIPYCHHEKWDGGGYPRGLKGEQIPLSARI
ncbi:MAG: transporter substrate-binding domain-containing protein, partial [Anaerolineae bacterium]|nr:transporter substrate-binding domain-containing protein [Anaerolineae bacterium]